MVKKIDSSNNIVTIDGYESEEIDEETEQYLTAYGDAPNMVNDGTEWYIV